MRATALTAEGFAPFGDVIEIEGRSSRWIDDGTCRRFDDPARIDVAEAGGRRRGGYPQRKLNCTRCRTCRRVRCGLRIPVLEHVPNPLQFARDLMRCVRSRGYLILAVPKFPSAINDIPNFKFNAPPHHLTWWSEQALRTLAETAGSEVLSLEGLPLGAHHRLGYWMGRMAPKLTGELYYKNARSWHAALMWSFVAGRLCSALPGTPSGAKPLELLLIARKP
ncbi:MAG: ureidoglycolate lyase [Steroidobacterales bacterium]